MAEPPQADDQDAFTADGCYVALAEQPLDPAAVLQRVRSPKAGANVLFAGSTRDNFDGRAVATLCYASYKPRALRSMREIAVDIRAAYGLLTIAIVHRLGPVPIGEDSILIAVSAAHRQAAWRGGEECLERVKKRAEIWKQEVFEPASAATTTTDTDGTAGAGPRQEHGGERVWRSNRDASVGMPAVVGTSPSTAPGGATAGAGEPKGYPQTSA